MLNDFCDLVQPTQFSAVPQSGQDEYNRDFMVDYLLRYCRLVQQTKPTMDIRPIVRAILQTDEANGEAYFLLGKQCEASENPLGWQEAFMNYERAASLSPDRPEYLLAASHAAGRMGQRKQALMLVGSVLETHPDLASAYYERGKIYEADENWDRALRDFQHCTRLNPKEPIYHVAEARMYRMNHSFKLARLASSKALRLDPDYKPALEEIRALPLLDQMLEFVSAASKSA